MWMSRNGRWAIRGSMDGPPSIGYPWMSGYPRMDWAIDGWPGYTVTPNMWNRLVPIGDVVLRRSSLSRGLGVLIRLLVACDPVMCWDPADSQLALPDHGPGGGPRI